MVPALFVVAALFVLLLAGRIGGARRGELMQRWPSLLFAGAALVLLVRGAIWPGVSMALLAVLAWILWPSIAARRPAPSTTAPDAADLEARAILGVSLTATESEIRTAYRAKMAKAHPDRGGGHAEAARLTAARDRLLKRRR